MDRAWSGLPMSRTRSTASRSAVGLRVQRRVGFDAPAASVLSCAAIRFSGRRALFREDWSTCFMPQKRKNGPNMKRFRDNVRSAGVGAVAFSGFDFFRSVSEDNRRGIE